MTTPKQPVNAAPLMNALAAWRKAEKRHSALVLGLIEPSSPTAVDDAGVASDIALHEVRKQADALLPQLTP